MRARIALFAVLALLFGSVRAQDSAQTVLHLLDYVAVDYAEAVENGRVKNTDEYKEMTEFASQIKRLLQGLPENPARSKILVDAAALDARIAAKAAPAEIAAKATVLR